jgi:hypothetical protein
MSGGDKVLLRSEAIVCVVLLVVVLAVVGWVVNSSESAKAPVATEQETTFLARIGGDVAPDQAGGAQGKVEDVQDAQKSALMEIESHTQGERTSPGAPAADDRVINDQTDKGAYTNPSDPYSKQANDAIIDSYVRARKAYLAKVTTFWFAADCGVLFSADHVAGEQNADIALQQAGQALNDLGRANDVTAVDAHVFQMGLDAAAEGRAQAAQPGACDYWRQHPNEVASLRQEVTNALRAFDLPR